MHKYKYNCSVHIVLLDIFVFKADNLILDNQKLGGGAKPRVHI